MVPLNIVNSSCVCINACGCRCVCMTSFSSTACGKLVLSAACPLWQVQNSNHMHMIASPSLVESGGGGGTNIATVI